MIPPVFHILQAIHVPPQYEPYIPLALWALGGLILGWLLTHLHASGKIASLHERIKAEERRNSEIEARLAQATADAERIEQDAQTYRNHLTELRSRLDVELKVASEKQQLLERSESRLADTFKALSADALKSSTEHFLNLAKNSLASQTETAKSEIEKRKTAIENLVKPVAESLGKFESRIGEIEKAREGAYAELKQQVKSLSEGQLGLQRETSSLVKALRQPAGRGQWGELQLKRVVELAGMQEHCDFETQTTSTTDDGKRLRPDLIVRLSGGKTIVVDAKTPMDAYLDALEADDEAEKQDALGRHARQVRSHIQQLSSKNYSSQFDQAPEFTVLFLPSESFFSAALNADPSLIEQGVDNGVILATPTTLIALLRAVAYGWRQEAMADNAREISALGRTLHERLSTLAGHFAKLGKSLGTAVEHYNTAIGSLETRVLTTARKFEELKATPEAATIETPEPLDKTTRELRTLAHAEPNPDTRKPLTIDQSRTEDLTISGSDDDFAFVPNPPASAKNAADDLRSALNDENRP